MNKKITLILVLALISWAAFGQTISTVDTLHTGVAVGETDVVGYGTVDNTFNQVKTYSWTRNEISLTSGWESAVCDKNLCYLPTIGTEEFMTGPLESDARLDVHIYPNGIDVGNAFIEITITDVNNANNTAVGYYAFDSNFTTGTQNASQTFFKVYPNPSTGLFTIEGDAEIEQVNIYSTTGQLLRTFGYNNLAAEWYDIAELPQGTYMLQLLGKDSEILGTKLMTKL